MNLIILCVMSYDLCLSLNIILHYVMIFIHDHDDAFSCSNFHFYVNISLYEHELVYVSISLFIEEAILKT